MAILYSDFFWGVVVGVLLTSIGSFLQVFFQSKQAENDRFKLVRNFASDTLRNIQRIVADMEGTRQLASIIHPDFLTLLDVEIGIFGRNREHIISLPLSVRDNVRSYVNDCSLIRAQIGGHLAEFTRLTNLANQLLAAGNDAESQRQKVQANAPLTLANQALDRLVTRSAGAAQLLVELDKI